LHEGECVVIDNGSGMMKAGFQGEESPSIIFPSIIGRAKYDAPAGMGTDKEFYVGDDAIAKRGVLDLTYPVDSGIINNWEDMERVWEHLYNNCLRQESSSAGVHLTEAPKNPTVNREKMAQIFFESFEVPAFYVSVQAVMALYASSRTDGLVYDSGDGVSHIVPVYQGFCINHAIKRMNLAGRELTKYFADILNESNISLTSTAEFDIVKEMKEAKCYVAQDFDEEMTAFAADNTKDVTYELPDGQNVTFGNQQIRCPEALFNPKVIGKEYAGAHKMIQECISSCDIDTRRFMYENIILSGGSTMFGGMKDRMVKSVQDLCNPNVSVKVTAANDRKYAVWTGAAVLSGLSTFESMFITSDEWAEHGSAIVHRKCF